MIGLGVTGKTVSDFEQWKTRFSRVVTTQLGTRERHRKRGSDARKYANKNASSTMLMQLQNEVMQTIINPENLLTDFTVERCVATQHSGGVQLQVYGKYNNVSVSFGEPLNV